MCGCSKTVALGGAARRLPVVAASPSTNVRAQKLARRRVLPIVQVKEAV